MRRKMIVRFVLAGLFLFPVVLFFSIGNTQAKVRGVCVNCHTMHQSQNGETTGIPIDYAATPYTPNPTLTRSDCIGCHSSTDSETIKYIGDGQNSGGISSVPIVYNTQRPTNPLAGGNFYWMIEPGVEKSVTDSRGHNVWGISDPDGVLQKAPGTFNCGGINCHNSLAKDPQSTIEVIEGKKLNGCQGCHVKVSHHTDDGAYRFLYSHMDLHVFVKGYEDPNWEHDPTPQAHNEYKGDLNSVYLMSGTNNNSISSFCGGGCHYKLLQGTGGASPWHRHPSNAIIPNSGEYAHYNDPNMTGVNRYNPLVPVARPTVYTSPKDVVYPGTDMVMCLSCHRAHASPYRDMLRWDYDAIVAGQGGPDGCFTCHTQKKGI